MPNETGVVDQVLSFRIGATDYGVPILKVREILQYEEPVPVPGAPDWIRGVLDVRGSVVPVVDLGVKFGKSPVAPTKRSCVLAVETRVDAEPLVLGVLADAVNEVVDLTSRDIEPPPAFGGGVKIEYLAGMGKVGKGFVLLLDIDLVLTATEAELASHVAVEAAAPDAAGAAEDAGADAGAGAPEACTP